MRHLDDGALRRLYDEPLALEEKTRAHYNDCAECQSRFSAIADDARQTSALLAVPGATVDDRSAARGQLPPYCNACAGLSWSAWKSGGWLRGVMPR